MTTHTEAHPQKRTTAQTPFNKINPAGDLLFAVREGIPALDALEMASCYMDSAKDITAALSESAEGNNENPAGLWGAFYLIEMAKAVLDAAISAAHREEKNHD